MLPFGNRVIRRSHLQRAAVAFGGVQSANPKGPAFRAAAQSEREKYDSSQGGMWNYDDLFRGLNELARGGDPEKLKSQMGSLTGAGEAQSKLSLLAAAIEKTPLLVGKRVEVGLREVNLGDDLYLSVEYDLSIKVDEAIYCYLIYPRAEPLKLDVRWALIKEHCAPFEGMSCPHKLIYLENPKVNGRRVANVEVIDFDFLGFNDNFRTFLKVFADEIGL